MVKFMASLAAWSCRSGNHSSEDCAFVMLISLRSLQCYACQKFKTLSYFSQKQLDAAESLLRSGKKPTTTKCLVCVEISTTKHEMKCIQCDKILSLDSFSKRQRKDPVWQNSLTGFLFQMTAKGSRYCGTIFFSFITILPIVRIRNAWVAWKFT